VKKIIIVHQHLGLGDHIDCNGLIRSLLKKYDEVRLFVKKKNHFTISKMFRDEPRIVLVPIDTNKENEYKLIVDYCNSIEKTEGVQYFFIQIGHSFYPKNPDPTRNCWEYFYEQVGINLDEKRDSFQYHNDNEEEDRVFKKLNPDNKPYAFVHDDPSRGFEADTESVSPDLLIIKNDMSENMLDFSKIIQNADEVHCMESSFKSLVELLPTKGKLFFHDFRGHPLGKSFKEWEIVHYDKVVPTTDY